MATMICANCGRYGIYWKNLAGLSPYTYCPNCGCENCQESEEPIVYEDAEEEEPTDE